MAGCVSGSVRDYNIGVGLKTWWNLMCKISYFFLSFLTFSFIYFSILLLHFWPKNEIELYSSEGKYLWVFWFICGSHFMCQLCTWECWRLNISNFFRFFIDDLLHLCCYIAFYVTIYWSMIIFYMVFMHTSTVNWIELLMIHNLEQ